MPAELGGAGLGLTEAALVMQAVAQSGAGFSGASAMHLNIFGPMPIVRYGSDELRNRAIPRLMSGEDKICIGITEPDAGLDTTSLTTRAVRTNDGYAISGRKVWTTMAQRANKMLIIARTTPRDQVKKATEGLSLFYTDFDRSKISATVIPKMGRKAVESNSVFIDNLEVPAGDLIGEEGRGFYYLLDGLNPERVLFAAEAVGLGRAALARAAGYAKERVVFGRPIGQNQGVAHPLARSWAELEAANLMAFKAAALFDAGRECGAEANAAKYLGGEAGFRACEAAVLSHGGMGYAKEFHVERYFREAMIARIAPISREMVLNYIAERVLGLPKSY
jgi:acyl-CoA dehydrogenase